MNWVGDKWCDNNCRLNENCFYDENDCMCDESDDPNNNCQQVLDLFGVIGDTTGNSDHAYHLSVDGVCRLWEYMTVFNIETTFGSTPLEMALYWSVTEYYELYPNCTVAFQGLDINGDGYMDPHEFMIVSHEAFNFTNTKAIQVNCTFAYYC